MPSNKPLSEITIADLKAWSAKQDPTRSNPLNETGRVCVYVDTNGDHCFAGQFFADHGVSDDTLRRYDDYYATAFTAARKLGFSMSLAQELGLAQSIADTVTTSGAANAYGAAMHCIAEISTEI